MTPAPTVVLAGDSITEWGRNRDTGELGDGYVGILAEGPLDWARVVNAGVGGDRLVDLSTRWDAEVLAEDPSLVSIYIGINDTWRAVADGIPSPMEGYENAFRALVEPLAQRGIPIVLVVPFVAPVTPDQEGWDTDLAPRQAFARALAAELGAALVDLPRLMADALGSHAAVELAEDGVHPTRLGHEMIADAWMRAADPLLTQLRDGVDR